METRRAETQATIHTIRSQLESLLANVELAKLDGVSLALDLVLDELTLFDQSLKHEGQDSILGLSAGLLGQFDLLAAHHGKIVLLSPIYRQ